MRRMRVLIAVLMVVGLLAPAAPAGAAETCGTFFGVARLQVFDTTTAPFAEGTAQVLFDGRHYRATIEETDAGGFGPPLPAPGVQTGFTEQVWEFGGMSVTFYETAFSQPLSGPMWSVDSEVEVIDGGDGHLRYDGLYDFNRKVARYFATGDICVET